MAEMTPAENRRRLAEARAGTVKTRRGEEGKRAKGTRAFARKDKKRPSQMARLTPEEWLAKREKRWALAFQLVEEGRAPERTRQAVELVKKGMGVSQIAEELGLSVSRAGGALRDPLDVETAKRKKKRFGLCEGCGRKTFNSGSTPPRFCHKCHGRGYAKWSPERIIAKMQEWNDIYGRAPGVQDWSPTHCRLHSDLTPERAARKIKRFEEGDWPVPGVVNYYFGAWSKALAAAGLKPNPPGKRWEDA